MLTWLKSRLIVIRVLFFIPFPIILAIWAWGMPALGISFILFVLFGSAMAAFETPNIFNIWCFSTTTSSVLALYFLAAANPALLGASLLGGFFYSLLFLITAIVLFPKIKE